MRGILFACGAGAALAASLVIIACANSEEASGPAEAGATVPSADGGPAVDPGKGADAEVERPTCSEAGWCPTNLPDEDLAMKDIWPVGGRAFAIADSPTLGVKVLEWNDAEEIWRYIDDSSQNMSGLGNYAGRIWAPDENEVYYGVGPGYIYHGTRPAAPATEWTWTRQALGAESGPGAVDPLAGYPYNQDASQRSPALGVWGTSATDVYAWLANTIYHLTSVDGGPREWVAEYVASDREAEGERLFFVAAAGLGPDGIWFSGARARQYSSCSLLVRKMASGYQRVGDGLFPYEWSPCAERPGSLLIGSTGGWLMDIHALSASEVIGLAGRADVVKVSDEHGSYSAAISPIPSEVSPNPLNSLWSLSGNLWLSGWGLVIRSSDDVWNGGTYRVSSISLTGAPLNRPIHQVRGTSNTNLWAIGVRNALHKTTP